MKEQEGAQCSATTTFGSVRKLVGIHTPIFVEFIVFGDGVGGRVLQVIWSKTKEGVRWETRDRVNEVMSG